MPRILGKPIFYGWIVVAGAWLLYLFNQAAFTWGFGVFVKPLADEFGWSRTSITVAWAVALGWGLLLGPWAGRIFDRYGPRPLILIGAPLVGIGWALVTLVHSYWLFFLVFVLLIGSGANISLGVASQSAVAVWFRKRRSLAMGIYLTSSGGAGLTLIPVMGLITASEGWRLGALVLGVVIAISSVPIALTMRHRPEQYGLQPDGLADAPSVPVTSRGSLRRIVNLLPLPKKGATAEVDFTPAEACRTAAFWMFTTAIWLRFVGMGMAQVHQIPHLLAEGFSLEVASAALSFSLVFNIPSRLLFGALGDIYEKKLILNVLALAQGGALLALARAHPPGVALVWLYAVLWGTGLAMLPVQAAWLGDTFGRRHYGAISSASMSISQSGRLVGALGAAVAYDVLGGYRTVMLFGAAGFVVGAVLLALMPPPRRSRPLAEGQPRARGKL